MDEDSVQPERAERKRLEEAAESILAEYRREAEWVEHSQDSWLRTAFVVTLGVDGLITYPLLFRGHTTAFVLVNLALALVWCGIWAVSRQNRKEALAEAVRRKPHFAEFYRAWRSDRGLRRGRLADAGEMGEIALDLARKRVRGPSR